ncbi:hypothetical protein KDAU_21860 [Dictyobacter aurantiacus]|uniref:Uncharacterized protein n=1 Tax=Dictyobacter aurantiacus TaxID=1936993 RepID=A0A401ZDA7_9CHLR|nr:hypothetical protein KDAU_21860 [Dictyobacter aurantiacus]
MGKTTDEMKKITQGQTIKSAQEQIAQQGYNPSLRRKSYANPYRYQWLRTHRASVPQSNP